MRGNFIKNIAVLLPLVAIFVMSCRKDDMVISSTSTNVTDGQDGEIKGFFLLNQGNMGSNKATLDYFDYTTGDYNRNIYAERNPNVVSELGDVGNDIKIWGSQLYAVINCSNLVEVMDVSTATHIGVVSIPNCRYITFKDNYAYVSSYSGEVSTANPNARRGYVAKVDTATLEIVATCDVGYQPEQMAIVGNKLYVANSGGYMGSVGLSYDNTVSVVDLVNFEELKQIEVAINLYGIEVDEQGKLWVSSRGDYYDTPSMTYSIDLDTEEITEYPLLPNTNMAIVGDSLYISGNDFSYNTNSYSQSYTIVSTSTGRTLERDFVDSEVISKIVTPFALAVNPYNKEIFITDAGDYVTPGKVYCFNADGSLKWSETTGDAPACIVFTNVALEALE